MIHGSTLDLTEFASRSVLLYVLVGYLIVFVGERIIIIKVCDSFNFLIVVYKFIISKEQNV